MLLSCRSNKAQQQNIKITFVRPSKELTFLSEKKIENRKVEQQEYFRPWNEKREYRV